MNIQLNGNTQQFDDNLTAAQLVEKLGLQGRRIAMEVNQEIIPRSSYESFQLANRKRLNNNHISLR